MAEYNPLTIITEALHDQIVSSVIPKMKERRNREGDLNAEQIREKLERVNSTGKPGELREFEEQIRRDVDGIDGEFAGEIADLVYYCSQKNCPADEITNMHKWFDFLEIPFKAAQEFCIIKYTLRLRYGSEPNYKVIENMALDKYIDSSYPELKTLWKNPIDPALS